MHLRWLGPLPWTSLFAFSFCFFLRTYPLAVNHDGLHAARISSKRWKSSRVSWGCFVMYCTAGGAALSRLLPPPPRCVPSFRIFVSISTAGGKFQRGEERVFQVEWWSDDNWEVCRKKKNGNLIGPIPSWVNIELLYKKVHDIPSMIYCWIPVIFNTLQFPNCV